MNRYWAFALVTIAVLIALGIAVWHGDWGAFGSIAITYVIIGASIVRDLRRQG